MTRLSVIVPATNDPATLPATLAALAAADEPADEVIVVDAPADAGPAEARNLGARRALHDVLVFVDADVAVHRDALARIRHAFERDPELVALFGSYDDDPAAGGLVSDFRNLLHHHVHQQGAGPATTFWAGLGAIRRAEFEAVGGFDAARFPRPSIEDIELGGRLVDRGSRIVLDPSIQGRHLKRWTLTTMVTTDLLQRGIPWVELMLSRRTHATTLNLGWRHRLSALASVVLGGSLLRRRRAPALGALAALVALNGEFYRLLVRRRGPRQAAAGVALHAVHHLTAAAAVPAGLLRHLRRRRS